MKDMEQEIKGRIVEFMDLALDGVDATTTFMQAQLPDYVEQLLMWYLVREATYFVIGAVLLAVSVYGVYCLIAKRRQGKPKDGASGYRLQYEPTWSHDEDGDVSVTILIIGIALTIPFAASFAFLNLTWLQILIAPKVWLVEYVTRLAS